MSVYTDTMVQTIEDALVGVVTASKVLVAELAESLEVSEKSLAAKIRNMGYTTENAVKGKTFTEAETAQFESLASAGTATAEDIAEAMGKTTAQIRGKALACKATLAPSPKKAPAVLKYTEAETETVTQMAENGDFIEDIAEAMNRTVAQIRGKLLSLKLKAPQRESKAKARTVVYTDEVIASVITAVGEGQSSADIAESLELNVRGLRSRLGRMLKAGDIDALPEDMGTNKGGVFNYTDEIIATLQNLSDSGMTSAEAAEEIGAPVGSVRAKSGKLGIKWAKATKASTED